MSNKELIIWNQDPFAERLRKKLGPDYVVTSEKSLLAADFDKYSGVVLLAELDWGRKRPSDLYGIDVAKTLLRAKLKSRLPLLFVSFLSPRQMRLDNNGKEILERRIVGAVGHDCLALPSSPRQWANKLAEMQPLTALQFADILNNFCDLKGLISETIHQLKNQYRALSMKTEPNQAGQLRDLGVKAFDEIVQLLGKTQEASDTRDRLLGDVDFESADARALQSFLTNSEEKFKLLVTEDYGDVGATTTRGDERLPWKVLLLDDEPESLTPICEALDYRGVDCEMAYTVPDAEKFIADDKFNEFVVVISDYRLLERTDGIERQQRKQGYDFLFELSERSRLTHLIALSGLSKKFLMESFQKYNARVEVYSKHDLSDRGAINLFADAVIDRGMEVYDALCSRPLIGEWPALKPFYAAHRQAADYQQREAEINERAKRFIIQYQSLLDSRDETDLLMPGLEILKNLSAKMKSKNPRLDSESMDDFKNKLIARRIALWLRLQLGYDSKQILAVLRGYMTPGLYLESLIKSGRASDVDEARKKFNDNLKSFLTTRLSLAFPNTLEHILVEEQQWLATEIGNTDWRNLTGVDRQISYLVHIQVEMFFEAYPELLGKLKKKSNDVSPKSGWPVITGMRAARDMLIAITEIVSTPQHLQRRRDLHLAIEKSVTARLKRGQRVDEFISWLKTLN